MSREIETLSRRVDELESQLAFQDELIESLNTTVARQDHEILELKHHFNRLSERMKEFGEDGAGAVPQDETPPHY
ncbi:MAG: SlyX family protein [Lysobacterales bacterium]